MKCAAFTWAEGKVAASRGLRAWAQSLSLAAPECEITVCSSEPLSVPGARNVVMHPNGAGPLHRRWAAYYLAIKRSDADVILLSDSRDLVFQDDPFPMLGDGQKLLVAGEYQKCGDHPWCAGKERELHDKIGGSVDLGRIEVNGGIQLGTRDAMLTMAMALESGVHGLSTDQAFLNWWLYNRCPSEWAIAPEATGWYLHGESVKTGKLKLELRDQVAYFKNGSDDEFRKATVWHQYDRTGHARLCHDRYRPGTKDMGVLVLVSHYQEPLTWLDNMEHEVCIVSKGANPPPESILRPNVGREAETWAWFFAEHYDELPELLVCLQGNPWTHVKRDFLGATIAAMIETRCGYSALSTPGHGKWTGIDTPDHPDLPMAAWWKALFPGTLPPYRWYTPFGGQFIVRREAVRARPKTFWEQIARECVTREDACTLERLWQFIFVA